MLFIDYEKAFDKVDKRKLQNILKENEYPFHLIQVIKSLYNGIEILFMMQNMSLHQCPKC